MERLARWAPWIVFASLAAWLVAAAALVQLEYFDGYDAILNARFLTGAWDRYIATRAPLVGALLVPGEWLHAALAAHPLDARPYHAVSALLHAGFLMGTYLLLRRSFGAGWATLLAFAAAVPTFVFFSYAPFVSHDIFPGVLLVGMVILAAEDLEAPSAGRLAGLVAIGAAAMLVKPVFAVFWAAVLTGEATAGVSIRRLARLGVAAAASAIVYLAVTSAATASAYPDTPFVLRGLRHFAFLAVETHEKAVVQPVWVYARNAWAYGPLAAVLAVPGLVLSWRSGGVGRRMAVAWVVVVVAFHVVSVRQVRYLAFLGAATAFVIVPTVVWILRRRTLVWTGVAVLALSVLPVHPYAAGAEAARIALPMYRRPPARDLLDPLAIDGNRLRTPIYFNNWVALSFVPERDTPFRGDLYHDVFHLADYHIAGLYGIPYREMIAFDLGRDGTPRRWPDGAALILCSTPHVVNTVSWTGGPAAFRDELVQTAFVARADRVRAEPGAGIKAHEAVVQGRGGIVLSGERIRAIRDVAPFAVAQLPGTAEPVDVLFSEGGEMFVPGLTEASLELRYFARVAQHRNTGSRPAASLTRSRSGARSRRCRRRRSRLRPAPGTA